MKKRKKPGRYIPRTVCLTDPAIEASLDEKGRKKVAEMLSALERAAKRISAQKLEKS
jgi:hypothetical protein